MNALKVMIGILAALMVLAIACSQPQTYAPAPAPETPQAPAQTAPASSPQAPGSSNAKTVAVSIQGFKFMPAEVTVNAGDTIVWTNNDNAPHTVESADGTLKSDELSQGDTYRHTFTKTGKYDYHCGIHASMRGSVMVQ